MILQTGLHPILYDTPGCGLYHISNDTPGRSPGCCVPNMWYNSYQIWVGSLALESKIQISDSSLYILGHRF